MVVQQHTEQAIASYFNGRDPQFSFASKLLANPFPGKTAKELTEMFCPKGGRLDSDRQAEIEVLIMFGYVSPNVLFHQQCTADKIIPGLAKCAGIVLCNAMKGDIIGRGEKTRRYKLAAAMYMSRWHGGPPVSHAQASLAIAGPPTGKWLTATARDKLAVIDQRAMDVWADEILAHAERTRADIGEPDAQDLGRVMRVMRAMRVWRDRLLDEVNTIREQSEKSLDVYEQKDTEIAQTIYNLRDGMNDFLKFAAGEITYFEVPGSDTENARANVRELATKLLDRFAEQKTYKQVVSTHIDNADIYWTVDGLLGYAIELFNVTVSPDDNTATPAASPVVVQSALADRAAPAAPDVIAQAASLDMRGVLADLAALLEQLRGQLAAGK